MKTLRWLPLLAVALVITIGTGVVSAAVPSNDLEALANVQKYDRAIHIMAMLLVGFGFLMVFVKKYGRSALTATFMLVSVAIPLYFMASSAGLLGEIPIHIDRMILAEFAAASLLICAGAALGRLKMTQYMLLAVLFIPVYAFNEWLLLEGGLSLIPAHTFVDTGGSIVIHMFGALFGIGVIMSMTTKKEFDTPIDADFTSDRYSLLGSMVLWVFWPSFCAALVPVENVPATAINVIIALCASTLATWFASSALRKKVDIADIANAALAGGVAIGSTCDLTDPTGAFIIGTLAGLISTIGFARIQPALEGFLKKRDTCGVLNLHGMPGLLGGIAAIFVVKGIDTTAQLSGIGITVVLALVAGLVIGKVISFIGHRKEPYVDSEEFEVE